MDVLVKVSKILIQKMSRPEGDSSPQSLDSCQMLYTFELSGPDICCPMFLDTGSGGIDIFWSKVNIWNVNCAQATAFIFDTRTDVLMKVWKFLRQKISQPEGEFNPLTFGFMRNVWTMFQIDISKLVEKSPGNLAGQTSAWHMTVFPMDLWKCMVPEARIIAT